MKLSFDTIKSITVGAVRIWNDNGNVHFCKCTQKQVDAWYKLEPILGERAENTTGIRLDFYTNSSTFSFTAVSGTKFEIYVNNLMKYNLRHSDIVDGSYSIKLDGAENRITLILPSHDAPGVISAIELDDGATVRPVDFDCKMMFIGDSITQGWDSGYDSLSYAYRVSRFFNADSVIHGVGGGFFHETIFDADVPYDPDIVVIAFGTNDWGRFRTLDALKEQAAKFLGAIAKKYAGKKIFAISPIWRADTENPRATGTFEDVCSAVKTEITNAGIILIDGLTLVPHHSDYYADVYLHPNALGFGIYAENLIRQMQKYL